MTKRRNTSDTLTGRARVCIILGAEEAAAAERVRQALEQERPGARVTLADAVRVAVRQMERQLKGGQQ